MARTILQSVAALGFTAAVAAGAAHAQTVEGAVREDSTGVAIAGADVTLVNQADGSVAHALTDESGRFSLQIPGVGLYRLAATRMGYVPFESDPFLLAEGQSVTADLFLELHPIELDPLDVVTEGRVPALARVGFYRRMENGIGQFLVREQIEEIHARRTTDLFRRVTGVQVVTDGSRPTRDVVMRSSRTLLIRMGEEPGLCFPSVSIDGYVVRVGGRQPVKWNDGGDREVGTWEELVQPDDIEAVEVYSGGAGLPPWAAGTVSPCGAILIWTR